MKTILLVDDESATLTLCRQMLTRGDYEVLAASGAEEALRIIQNAVVDLLLSDVVMPGMNGIELAKRVQSMYPHTRVVLMSGYASGDIEHVAGGHNPYRIIWKPFKAESLLRMIENIFDQPEKSGPAGATSARDFIIREED